MLKDTQFQRYKERICNRARHLRDGFARLWTKSMAWIRRWAVTISQSTWKGLRRAGGLARYHAPLCWVVIGLIGFILILWILPKYQVAGAKLSDKERLELIDKARGTLAQILASAGIAVGLYWGVTIIGTKTYAKQPHPSPRY